VAGKRDAKPSSVLTQLLDSKVISVDQAKAAEADGGQDPSEWIAKQGWLPRPLLEQARRGEPLSLRHYVITGRLGKGAMGSVLRARDTHLDREVAIKALPPGGNPAFRDRLLREAEALARLDHPNVVRVFAREQVEGLDFLVLELVPGRSLQSWLSRGLRFDDAQAWTLVADVCAALGALTAEGLVHRDLKPANVIWHPGQRVYKVCDLGLVKAHEGGEALDPLTMEGTTLGTPAYMSPEQIRGQELDARSDMYSLGITLYEGVRGEPPHGGKMQELLIKHLKQDVPPLADASPPLRGLISDLTARQRALRPESWVEVAERVPPAMPRSGPRDGGALQLDPNDSARWSGETVARPSDSDDAVPVSPPEDGTTAPDRQPPGSLEPIREPALGEVLGDYALESVLGRGGMGIVYRARRLRDDRPFAVKALVVARGAGSERRRQRFQREIEALRRLRHPNVVSVHTQGRKGPFDWYAMDFVEGLELQDHLRERRLDRPQRLSLFIEICRAVGHAHDKGVVHRDLKPNNVLIDADGAPHVLDFGVAKIAGKADTSLTRTGSVLGTPHYMAPEQFSDPKSVDARTDVFALGVILYEIMASQRPFEGETAGEVSYKILHGKPKRPSRLKEGLDPSFDGIVLKALEKDPSRRFQTVTELRKAVVKFRRGGAVAETALARLRSTVRRWLEDNRKGVFVGALLALLFVYAPTAVVIYFLLW
jgi:serine/threonine protein kinase